MDIEITTLQPDDVDGVASVHVDAWQAAYRGVMADEFLDLSGDAVAECAAENAAKG